MFILDLLKGYNVEMQQNIMHKVVSRKLLVDVLPPYLQDVLRLKQTQQLLDNFKFGLTSHGMDQ
jgi:hypothetical protein